MKAKNSWNVIAGLYGNALEWFDFVLYASFAPILATLFFPNTNVLLSLLATFGVFALGFIARPLGGLILGFYSDLFGRRRALLVALSVMSAACFFIGFLPTYASIGVLAPILLTFLRTLQGLAMGGEFPSSTAYLIEILHLKRRSFAGSLPLCVGFFGMFCGAITATLTSSLLSKQHLFQYGWRLAFIGGAVLGVIGIYLRLKSRESELFLQEQDKNIHPLKMLFTKYKLKLFVGFVFTSILALGNYLLIAFTPSYLVKLGGFRLQDASLICLVALFCVTILIPLGGILADRHGRRPVFLTGVIGLIVAAFPIFWLLQQHSFALALLSQIILAFCLGPINGTVPVILSEMFITPIRNSGISLSYNLSQAVFGGTAPLIAFFLIDITHSVYMTPVYLVLCALFSLSAALLYTIDFVHNDVLDKAQRFTLCSPDDEVGRVPDQE